MACLGLEDVLCDGHQCAEHPSTGSMASYPPPSPAAMATTQKEEQECGGVSLVSFPSRKILVMFGNFAFGLRYHFSTQQRLWGTFGIIRNY